MNTVSTSTHLNNEHHLNSAPDSSHADLANNSGALTVERRFSLSTLLRLFGTCAVIASLSLFLLEGWTEGNDLNRYLKLLAQTGLITGAGIFLSFVIKEVKGARLFFGLGLVSAVANFTILGALTYSVYQLDGSLTKYPSMLQWQALDMSVFIPVLAAAVVFLSLLSRFSFSIFARQRAATLTTAFLGLNALLLLPVRDAMYVSVMAAVALLCALKFTASIIKDPDVTITTETKYALACLFLPGLIIISRALSLYAVDEAVLLSLFGITYYSLRQLSLMLDSSSSMQRPIALFQYLLAPVIGVLLATLMPHHIDSINHLVFSLVMIAITCDIVTRQRALSTTEPSFAGALIAITSIGLVFINTAIALDSHNWVTIIASLLVAIALFALVNFYQPRLGHMKGSHVAAMIGVVANGLLLVSHFVSLINVGAWAIIGGLGIGLILVASLYERFGFRIKPQSHKA